MTSEGKGDAMWMDETFFSEELQSGEQKNFQCRGARQLGYMYAQSKRVMRLTNSRDTENSEYSAKIS